MVWDGVDRRHGIDWRIRALRTAAVASWVLFIVCLILFHFARPEMNSGIARYYGVTIRSEWNFAYTGPLLYGIWFCAGLSFLSFLVGLKRSRRAEDTRRYNLILLTTMTVACGILLTYRLVFAV